MRRRLTGTGVDGPGRVWDLRSWLSLYARRLALSLSQLAGERSLHGLDRGDCSHAARTSSDALPSRAAGLAHSAVPLDLIPDFILVLGYADDAIIVLAVLRSTARHVGIEPLRAHWPCTEDGFTALCRAAGLART